MPESRDRISRTADVAALFFRQREIVRNTGILPDDERIENLLGSPRTVVRTPAIRRPELTTASRGFRTPRFGNGRGRNLYRSMSTVGRENTPPMGSARRGRGRSVLPSWYPRTPLRDVTSVVRAIERQRSRLGDQQGQEISTPLPRNQTVLNSSAPLEHDSSSMVTPNPITKLKVYAAPLSSIKVQKILLDITNRTNEKSEEFSTPQKKLLNSIDTVEKVVMEELRKLKKTPIARREEREKRVRTLMTMR